VGCLSVASGINLFDSFDNLIIFTLSGALAESKGDYFPRSGRFFLKMALYSELPVYKATYDLLLAIFWFTKDFGKEYKYTVGESLKKETIELLTLIYRANVKRDKQEVLQEARERIEVIRLFIRLMKDMQQISVKQFVQINEVVENVSKQLSGWQKAVS
jgi:hypothetical protein